MQEAKMNMTFFNRYVGEVEGWESDEFRKLAYEDMGYDPEDSAPPDVDFDFMLFGLVHSPDVTKEIWRTADNDMETFADEIRTASLHWEEA